MKKFESAGMKNLKIVHLIFVMLWTVGVISMGVLLLLSSESGDELYMKYKAVRFIDDLIVIPSATLTVIIGVIYGLKSNWGFFKHKWITIKWIISIIVVIVGTFVLSPMLDTNLAISDSMRDPVLKNNDVINREILILISSCCTSVTLVVLVAISVLKPWKKKKTV